MELEINSYCKQNKFKCNVDSCIASFRKKCYLEIHLRKHNNERPFICDVPDCQKSYITAWHLKRHQGQVHEKAEEIMCDIEGCGLVLSNKYNLKKHKYRQHNESNCCSVCSQKFNKRWQLNEHSFLHTGESRYKCAICNISFNKFHLYNKHKRTHKTYSCDCGKEFTRWTLFIEHRRSSCTIEKIEHKCIICQKVFTTKTNLRQHTMKIHLEESMSHRCHYLGCSRGYKFKKNLMFHIRTFHEKDNNKIKCIKPGCDTYLKNQRNLKRHIANVHKEASKPNTKKERRPRKDKGEPKKCMASILSGVDLTVAENKNIINRSSYSAISSSEETDSEKGNITNSKNLNEAKRKETTDISQSSCEGQQNNVESVENNDLDMEDPLLQICGRVMTKIQEYLNQTPVPAVQESSTYFKMQA
ncbi:transcription factor IIIA [Leptinotarsa decemlineata]|uniref:transcription factor IIIA n=1 Tax=Leptinotarsa decemlineata TaxID=7539 RepID=UPI000C253E22|nr:transcription factor IIIA [Leptinotarsa decemlineata]